MTGRDAFGALFIAAFMSFTIPVAAQMAEPTPMTASGSAQVTATITAIDYNTRTVTLRGSSGDTMDFQAGPEVKRFNALKVGDTVTFTYQESVVLAIKKPGASDQSGDSQEDATKSASTTPNVVPLPGDKPGGQVSQTLTADVTIQAIDMSKPSVTVKTQDGRVVTLAVSNKENLNGLKVGDVVRITYSRALMITVK